MQKHFLFILASIVSFTMYSQISFEKGYYIDNADRKIECLIKNVDWQNNPTEFEYKLLESSEVETTSIKSVKEFGIYEDSQYVRASVDIDRSSSVVRNLTRKKEPAFQTEELFLEVLINAKASLYIYDDENITRFFYSNDNSEIKQLIFKKYFVPGNRIAENNRYKQQLWNDLSCSSITLSQVERLSYTKKKLVGHFIDYNECLNEAYTNFVKNEKRDLFNLNIRPGINSSSLSYKNINSPRFNADFENKITARFGLEAEFILPYNKNKWAIIVEPTYQYYKADKESELGTASVNYTSIEIPMGIRHYLFLNDNSKLFVNGSYVVDLEFDYTIEFEIARTREFKTRDNIALGMGYKYNDTYSVELRYYTTRQELQTNFVTADYKTISVIFGYSLF